MLKKLLSYLYPITISRRPSSVSKALEVTLVNGRLVLDTPNANYSFGSLQRVLDRGLQAIGYPAIKGMSDVLVLGVAGGSIFETLRGKIGYRGKLRGVDIDPGVIDIAQEHFSLDAIENLEIIIADARQYLQETCEPADLIVIDIFCDKDMPSFLFETTFLESVSRALQPGGFILFNTIVENKEIAERNAAFTGFFESSGLSVRKISHVEGHNELLIVH